MKIKKIIFFLKRLRTDLKENKEIELNLDYPNDLNYYYIKFKEELVNSRGGNKAFQFDDHGVPQVHSYIDVQDRAGYYYYPITIGQYALAVFHSYLNTHDEQKKAHFLRIAEWFYENKTEDDKLGVYWLTETPKPEYRITKPWKSAFSQSRGLSVLLRAWQLTGDIKYLEVCKKALIPFTYSVSEGGVAVDLNTAPFYEEYIAEKPTRVLDGHMFSLFGVYDAVRAITPNVDADGHNLALQIFNAGIEGLVKRLYEYDLGFWMKFNLCDLDFYPSNDPCTVGYLRLVTAQLQVLERISENKVIGTYVSKLRSYDRSFNIVRMYKLKFTALKKMNRL